MKPKIRLKRPTEYLASVAPGYRIRWDTEGYPYLPGKNGHIEWYTKGILAIYTQKPRLVARFLALPGAKRHQMGDQEARMLIPVSSLSLALPLAKTPRKRVLSPEQARSLGRGTAFGSV